jgi:hypothetical protein
MGRGKALIVCMWALAAVSCTTNKLGPGGAPLPVSMHADLIFVGRIVSSEPIFLVNGDVFSEGWERTFEAVHQPGSRVVAVDGRRCPDGDLGDKALLVFLESKTAARREAGDRKFYVYACPVVDVDTIRSFQQFERCFGTDSAELNCFD